MKSFRHAGRRGHNTRPASRSRRGIGLARALSKLGFCSRREAWALIVAGRVRVQGVVERDPEQRVDWELDRIEVDGLPVRAEGKVYLMLNKPRGLVTTTSDEQGRPTVFQCLGASEGTSYSNRKVNLLTASRWKKSASGGGMPSARDPLPGGTGSSGLPRVFPVGRLDKASEGLLLFTNDTAWAARITDPSSHLDKIYHVQVDCLADDTFTRRLQEGVSVEGDFLAAKCVRVLRCGERNSWLEVVLDEGKNRHIRRLLAAFGVDALRLVRAAIGPVVLGALAKGRWRYLAPDEIAALTMAVR